MRTQFAIIAIFSLIHSTAKAQWQQNTLPLDADEDLYGISFLSSSSFVISSNTQVSKTTDSGVSWEVHSLNSGFPANTFLANTILDIHFYDANKGVATGVFNLTNNEIVIETSNGGNKWMERYFNATGVAPIFFSAMDIRDNLVLACGENGHIIRSTNFGSSFEDVNNAPNRSLYDVKFVNNTIALAVGWGIIFRSCRPIPFLCAEDTTSIGLTMAVCLGILTTSLGK